MVIRTLRLSLSIIMLLLATSVASFEYAFEVSGADIRERLRGSARLTSLRETSDFSPQDIVAAAQADYRGLTSVLYEAGHFSGVVHILIDGREAAEISQIDLPKDVRTVLVRIETGPAFRYGRIGISPLAEGTLLPSEFSEGAPASLSVMKQAVETAIEGWRHRGHAKAFLSDQSVAANHTAREVSIKARIMPGPRLRFGRLNTAGTSSVRPERIRQIAGLPEGANFDPDDIAAATRRLRRTGTFAAVVLTEARNAEPDATLSITADVSDRLPRSFGAGAELSSLDGLALSAYWVHRNLFGGAERLRLEGEVTGIRGKSGGEDGRVTLRFDRPATFNEDTDFFAEAVLERRNDTVLDATSGEVRTGIRRYASKKRTYDFAVGIKRASTDDAFGRRDYSMLTLPAGAVFDFRDDPLDARFGWYASVALTPFAGLSGMPKGLATSGDFRVYNSIEAARGITFAGRLQIGSVAGPSLAQAPADMLFFSGGGGTVRGQPFQSNAIDLGAGLRTGGRSVVGISAEARLEISRTLNGVVFADAGYVGSEIFPDGSGSWHSGAGVGFRYDTGVGPLRVDFAMPFSGPGGSGLQLYIGIGQAF